MDAFDILAIMCLALIIGSALYLGWLLFELPGKLAFERSNPNAQAIRVCGWLGIVTGMLFWSIAMVLALWNNEAGRKIS